LKSWLTIFLIISTVTVSIAFLQSCGKDKGNSGPTVITIDQPAGFPPIRQNAGSPLTEEAFALGRRLFYDPRLSKDGTVSCASCHQPEAAFTVFEHDRAHGYKGAHTLRNPPGLFNLAWYPYFNQDGSGSSLPAVIKAHIENGDELASSLYAIERKLKHDPSYRSAFRSAFGTDEVSGAGILSALQQFLLLMVSTNTKYDQVQKGEASFTATENAGFTIFKNNCARCHTEPLFTDFSFRNTGLPVDVQLNDRGRMSVTGLSSDSLKFRVPSLRNVEFTAYYMHDGRKSLVRNAIEHYRSGIVQSATLDEGLKTGISLTDADITSLVAFLRTLSDSSFLTSTRFRNK